MGMVFVCLALVNYLTSQASSGSQQRTSSQGRQGASGGQQDQQGARESKPQPEADAGAQSRSSAASSGVDSSRTSSGVNSSSPSPGAAGGSARGAQDEGARQRPTAAAPAASGKDDLANRLGTCSVITPLPRPPASYRIPSSSRGSLAPAPCPPRCSFLLACLLVWAQVSLSRALARAARDDQGLRSR